MTFIKNTKKRINFYWIGKNNLKCNESEFLYVKDTKNKRNSIR